jgi:peptidoglycan hydrolase-like protein with peptidoglycan-binding domain
MGNLKGNCGSDGVFQPDSSYSYKILSEFYLEQTDLKSKARTIESLIYRLTEDKKNLQKELSLENLNQKFDQPRNYCLELKNNLWKGRNDKESNGEVSKLQNFLLKQGYFKFIIDGYFGDKTATAVFNFQKDNGMNFVTLKSGVGPQTRAILSSCYRPLVNWKIELANPSITDENDYKKYEQKISIQPIYGDGSTPPLEFVAKAYGCNVVKQNEWSRYVKTRTDGAILSGVVNCYFALSGNTFTAFLSKGSGKYFVESIVSDGVGEKPAVKVWEK